MEIREYPEGRRGAVGRIVEILGAPGELGTYLETVIRRHRLPRRFSDEALEEAEALPDAIDDEEIARRRDLRGEPTFTIDGADARDFDDAVALSAEPGGAWRLRVSIADVAHWVHAGSPLELLLDEAHEKTSLLSMKRTYTTTGEAGMRTRFSTPCAGITRIRFVGCDLSRWISTSTPVVWRDHRPVGGEKQGIATGGAQRTRPTKWLARPHL